MHEWAHLRWGVFDEYNREKPFYINGQNQVKVTRLVDLRMFKIRCYYLFIYVVLSFEGPTGGIWKFPGQRANPRFCSDLNHRRGILNPLPQWEVL